MTAPVDLPRPLVVTRPPAAAPDAEAERLVMLLGRLHAAVRVGMVDPALLASARFEVYRQASISWGDPWRMARVAELEELTAEAAVQRHDLEAAWHAWRAGWWIRHLLREHGEGVALFSHSDRVMAALRQMTGRGD